MPDTGCLGSIGHDLALAHLADRANVRQPEVLHAEDAVRPAKA